MGILEAILRFFASLFGGSRRRQINGGDTLDNAAPLGLEESRQPVLEVRDEDGRKVETRPLTEGSLSIGRGPGNDLRTDHESVSRRHAVLHTSSDHARFEQRCVIEALQTPVFVNGGRFTTGKRALSLGDRIHLGEAGLIRLEFTSRQRSSGRGASRLEQRGAAARDQKAAWREDFLERHGGEWISAGDDGDSPEWRGTRDGRPARIQFDDTWGYPTLQIQIDNNRGVMCLTYDPEERDRGPAEPHADDPWGSDDDRIFLGPGFWADDQMFVDVWESLSERLQKALEFYFTGESMRLAIVNDEQVQVSHHSSAADMSAPADTLTQAFELAAALAAAFEDADGWVGLEPGVYVDGRQVEDGHSPYTADCDYCGATAFLNANSACPNCGAPLSA